MNTPRHLSAFLPLLLAIAACSKGPDRHAELAACQLISKSGDELAQCLVLKFSWGADSAAPAKAAWQWTLDSIRLEHEKQAAAILGQQVAHEESLATQRAARQRRLEAIDSAFWACASPFRVDAIQHGEQTRNQSGQAACLKARGAALQRAGFPATALPDPEL